MVQSKKGETKGERNSQKTGRKQVKGSRCHQCSGALKSCFFSECVCVFVQQEDGGCIQRLLHVAARFVKLCREGEIRDFVIRREVQVLSCCMHWRGFQCVTNSYFNLIKLIKLIILSSANHFVYSKEKWGKYQFRLQRANCNAKCLFCQTNFPKTFTNEHFKKAQLKLLQLTNSLFFDK